MSRTTRSYLQIFFLQMIQLGNQQYVQRNIPISSVGNFIGKHQ